MPITICPVEQCTGCAACVNVCPKRCISMIPDVEGFLRPEIDSGHCDDCGACERVCPILHTLQANRASGAQCYASWNKDEAVRSESASGGVFSALADCVLNSGGVVFGAAFDENMRLNHIAASRKEELGKLRSSKYVQSSIDYTYTEIQNLLKQNRKVLFSGTPCQVAALYALIGKEDKNIFTCDVICFGVSSPGLFAKYLEHLERFFRAKLVNINVRHKRKGWNLMFSTVAFFSDGRERVFTGYNDSFMYGFLNYICLRPACYQCSYTKVDRLGDITLGDFWGIGDFAPFHHSIRNGISLVLVNSEKGRLLFEKSSSQLYFEKRTMEEARYNKPQLSHPLPKPKNREQFFFDYNHLGYAELAKKHLVDKGVKGLIKRIVPRTCIFYLRKSIFKIGMVLRHLLKHENAG